MKTEIYNISGMSCAACSASVNRVVSRLEGVVECDVNLLLGKMTVKYDAARVGDTDIFRVVEKAGFGIEKENGQKESKNRKETKSPVYPIIISAVFSFLLLLLSMGTMLFPNMWLPRLISPSVNPQGFAFTHALLCLPALYFGRCFFIKGIPLLFKGHPNMDSLVAVGALASLIYSVVITYTLPFNHHGVHNLYYESVAVVITLVMLGKALEAKSRNKTLGAITALMELSPETAIIEREGKTLTLPTEEVKVGDILVVKAGSKIPLDGVVMKGETAADEAMLTGESMPVLKTENSTVIGGSINLNGLIYVRVTHVGADTALAKIIKFVEEAAGKKAPIAKTADRVAGIFTPAVMVIALLSSLIWLLAGENLGFALKIFTSVLVVACPCSLGLATPTAIMVGTGIGAKNGILISNGEVLETTHKIKAAVFDKTGTVTEGRPRLCEIAAKNENRFLTLLCSAEKGSGHPLARAVADYADENGIPDLPIEEFEDLPGRGIICRIENKKITVGTAKLLEENGIDIGEGAQKARESARQGKSVIFVAEGNEYLGFTTVADQLKPTSKQAFSRLRSMGIKTVLLSGDNRESAEYAGSLLAADEVYSEVLPTQKAEIIEKIKEKYGKTLMVGDGINDAPALARADVGCAIGSGSDVAAQSADIVLMKSDPTDAVKAINLSRFTIKNIKENLFWAFCYNTVLIPVAAGAIYPFTGVLLSPMLAGLAMSLSSVFVVGNALRLKFKEKKL